MIGPILKEIIILALCTGMRKKEMKCTTWSHVDLRARIITVGRTKTRHGSFRRIPLNDRAMKMLTAWAAKFPDRKPSYFLFPSSRSVKKGVWGFNPDRPFDFAHQTWQKLLKKANVKVRFHDLRHTVCTRMLEAGIPGRSLRYGLEFRHDGGYDEALRSYWAEGVRSRCQRPERNASKGAM